MGFRAGIRRDSQKSLRNSTPSAGWGSARGHQWSLSRHQAQVTPDARWLIVFFACPDLLGDTLIELDLRFRLG